MIIILSMKKSNCYNIHVINRYDPTGYNQKYRKKWKTRAIYWEARSAFGSGEDIHSRRK